MEGDERLHDVNGKGSVGVENMETQKRTGFRGRSHRTRERKERSGEGVV